MEARWNKPDRLHRSETRSSGISQAKDSTEPDLDNAHSGEKSDEFGSGLDQVFWNPRELGVSQHFRAGEIHVVCGSFGSSPADRARWLAELSEALDEAAVLVTRYALMADNQPEAFELYLRIEAARLEVHALRLSRSLNPRDDLAP